VWVLVVIAAHLAAGGWYAAYEIGSRDYETLGAALAIAGAVALVLAIAIAFIDRTLVLAGPAEAIIVTGRGYATADGTHRGFRIVIGGRVLPIPLLERADRLDLMPVPVDITLTAVPIRRGEADITFRGSAKIPAREQEIANAIERFLGKTPDDIQAVVTETVTGAARGVLGMTTIEDLREDSLKVADHIRHEAEDHLDKMGLTLERLHIVDVRTRE
jgi:flotillin